MKFARLVILAAAAALAAARPYEALQAAPHSEAPVADLGQRLLHLDPADPMGYFLLAEEVAAEARSQRALEMARALYVLAFELSAIGDRPSDLAASVYLGLAAIARGPEERHWLITLARSEVNWDVSSAMTEVRRSGSPIDPGAMSLADAITAARAGDGRMVKILMRREEVRRALDRIGADKGRIETLLDDAVRQASCPGCYGRRFLRPQLTGDSGDEPETLCPVCRGNPGPSLDGEDFSRTVEAQVLLLGARQSSWSAQFWLDRGAAFVEPHASALAARFAVDPLLPYWRAESGGDPLDGRWVGTRN